MKKIMTALTVVAVISLASVALAQQQGGGGRDGGQRRGMMGSAMFIEQSWSALCFEMDLSQVQFGKLKPTYVWAYKARESALKSARETRSFDAAAKTLATIKSTLEERIPIVLTDAQKVQWKKWQAEQAARQNRMREGAGGRGGVPRGQK